MKVSLKNFLFLFLISALLPDFALGVSNEGLLSQLGNKFCKNGKIQYSCDRLQEGKEPLFCDTYNKNIDYELLGHLNGLYTTACQDSTGTMLSNANIFIFSSTPGSTHTEGVVCKDGFDHPSGVTYSKYKCVKKTASDSSSSSVSDSSASNTKPAKDPCGFTEEDKKNIDMHLALIDMGKVEIGESLEYSPKYECDSRFSAKLSTWKSNCVTHAGGEAKPCTADNPGEKAFCCIEKPSEQKSTTDTTPQKTNTENATPSAPESNQVYKKQGPFTKALKKCDTGSFMVYKDYSGQSKQQNEAELQEWQNACTSLANCRRASEMTWKVAQGDKIDTYTCVPKKCLPDFPIIEYDWCEQIPEKRLEYKNQGPFPKSACYNGPFNLYHYYTGTPKMYNHDELKLWKKSCENLADCKHASKMGWDVVTGDTFDTYSCVPKTCLPDYPKKEKSGCEKDAENEQQQKDTDAKKIEQKINAAVSRGVKPGDEINLESVSSDATVVKALSKWEKSCTQAKAEHAKKIEAVNTGNVHSCKITSCDKGFNTSDGKQCTPDNRESSVSDAAQKAIDQIEASINHGVKVGSSINVGAVAEESDVAAALAKWEKACRKSTRPEGAQRIDVIPQHGYGRQCVITSCDEKKYTLSADNLSCVKNTTETNETEETNDETKQKRSRRAGNNNENQSETNNAAKEVLDKINAAVSRGVKPGNEIDLGSVASDASVISALEKWEKSCTRAKVDHAHKIEPSVDGTLHSCKIIDCDKGFVLNDNQCTKDSRETSVSDAAQKAIDNINASINHGVQVGSEIKVGDIAKESDVAAALEKWEKACRKSQKPDGAKRIDSIPLAVYGRQCVITSCDEKDYTRSSDNLSCVKKTTETNETEETKSRSRKEQEEKQTKKHAASDEEVQQYLDEINRILKAGVHFGDVMEHIPPSTNYPYIYGNPKLKSAYHQLGKACQDADRPAHAEGLSLYETRDGKDFKNRPSFAVWCAISNCEEGFTVDNSKKKCITNNEAKQRLKESQKTRCTNQGATYNEENGNCYCGKKLWAWDDSKYWEPGYGYGKKDCGDQGAKYQKLCEDHGGQATDFRECVCTTKKKREVYTLSRNTQEFLNISFNPETHKCTADKEIVALSVEEQDNSNQNETSDKNFLSDVDKIINAYKETVQKIKQTGDDE